jgi:hypothetical protein
VSVHGLRLGYRRRQGEVVNRTLPLPKELRRQTAVEVLDFASLPHPTLAAEVVLDTWMGHWPGLLVVYPDEMLDALTRDYRPIRRAGSNVAARILMLAAQDPREVIAWTQIRWSGRWALFLLRDVDGSRFGQSYRWQL